MSPAKGPVSTPGKALWILVGGLCALLLALGLPAAATASIVDLENDGLDIEGDDDSDQITVSTDGTTLTVTDTGTGGVTAAGECSQVSATVATCPVFPDPFTEISYFEVELYSGVDSFTNTNFVTDYGHVHSQTSSQDGSATGAKTISGGPGSQLLEGGLDSDTIEGGPGNDDLEDGSGFDEGSAGNDVLVGGEGRDTADYSRETAVSVTLDGVANDGQAGETDNAQVEDVYGGAGNDTLTGDGTANLLWGGNGDDLVQGLAGNDDLIGDAPGLRVERGDPSAIGNDILDGGSGRDDLDCGPGLDSALVRSDDRVARNCERIGAAIVADNAPLTGKRKNKFKVALECSAAEVKACTGKLKLAVGGKKAGKGKFSVKAGATKNAKAKLSKKGLKALRGAGGSMLVTVRALTNEPGGFAEDSETVFVYR